MAKVIRIEQEGLLANQMFQYLLARILQSKAPESVITGLSLPEFGIADEADPRFAQTEPGARIVRVNGHVFPFHETIDALKREPNIEVRVRWPTTRMEYLTGHVEIAREAFPSDPRLGTGFDASHLVIHVRAEEILRGIHPNYTVLPIAWYRQLIAESGLEPVFIGQIGADRYSLSLREAFPQAQFIRHDDPLEDFNRLRSSVNVVLSVSTFCWIAVWMSQTMRRAYLPVIGMYNPYDRPDIDMLPVRDRRYRFYEFESRKWTAAQDEIEAKISGPADCRRLRWPRLYRAQASFALKRQNRLRVSVSRDLRAVLP